uniref:TraB domain-containing protein n=1 Tax=Dracunculus medinensis TaxID=318479 RepID=A0A0N4U5F5_DRAME
LVYLVGTAHFSSKSQEDVLKTITSVQPDVVAVELCESRMLILSMDEEKALEESRNMDFKKILHYMKDVGTIQGIIQVAMISLSAHITRKLGMAPGGEFRAAYAACKTVPACRFVLCDRPIQITLNRAVASLSIFQKMRLFVQLLRSSRADITAEEVEKAKEGDVLDKMLKEMSEQFPTLAKTLIEERDLFIILIFVFFSVKWQKVVVVAVLGMGHIPGIVANWEKDINIRPLYE